MNYFQNIFETEVDDVHMNHTPANATIVSTPSKSAYLFWQSGMTGMEAADKAIGPAIALSVTPGDTIKAETYVRYENKTSYNRTGFTMSVLSALLGNSFVSVKGFEGSTLAQTTQKFSDALSGGGFLGDTGDDTRPYAYLNYVVFDQSMARITSDWVRITEDGGFEPGEEGLPGMHAQVDLDEPLVIPANGKYIYLWVSNESENTKVWFDDLKVTHVTTFVAQATDYGVWGDVLREQKTDESVYRYAYQGQFSERDLETGWSHFELREYDPVIGRWLVPDPARQYPSPYVAYGNNPISRIDSDGGTDGDPNEGSVPFSVGFAAYRNKQRTDCDCANPFTWTFSRLANNFGNGIEAGFDNTIDYVTQSFTSLKGYRDAVLPNLTFGVYGLLGRIEGTANLITGIPDYTADDYAFGAGFAFYKFAESVALTKSAIVLGNIKWIYPAENGLDGMTWFHYESNNRIFRLDWHNLSRSKVPINERFWHFHYSNKNLPKGTRNNSSSRHLQIGTGKNIKAPSDLKFNAIFGWY
jgi:RHS repeat-associated protein